MNFFKELLNSGLANFYLHFLSKSGFSKLKEQIRKAKEGKKKKYEKEKNYLEYLKKKKENFFLTKVAKIVDKHLAKNYL